MLHIRNLNTTKKLKIGIRKDQNRISSILVSLGGESEIRTLEPCYRLHDFQSCALDQLGEFSLLPRYYIILDFKNQDVFSKF